jgi:hypothetical protein
MMTAKKTWAVAWSLVAGLFAAAPSHAAGPSPRPERVEAKPGGVVKVHGKLGTGAKIELGWAAQSSVACFPANRNVHFNGNVVFYKTSLPAASVMKVRAIPSRPNLDVNLFAYSTGVNSNVLPPNVPNVVSCEASHGGRKYLNQPFNPGETERIELNAIRNPYDVVIGVAGAQGITEGDFDLEIELSGGGPPAPTGKIKSATPIAVAPNKTVSVSGKIDGGVQIPLGFAAQSSVACFPATTNGHYNGNHVVYSFDLPTRTTAKIELVPTDPKSDLSLYAYTVGPAFPALPPDVSSVVSCEASPGANRAPNPGGAEKVELVAITNPYKAYVAVAGAQGATTGAFTLKVTLSGR